MENLHIWLTTWLVDLKLFSLSREFKVWAHKLPEAHIVAALETVFICRLRNRQRCQGEFQYTVDIILAWVYQDFLKGLSFYGYFHP